MVPSCKEGVQTTALNLPGNLSATVKATVKASRTLWQLQMGEGVQTGCPDRRVKAARSTLLH